MATQAKLTEFFKLHQPNSQNKDEVTNKQLEIKTVSYNSEHTAGIRRIELIHIMVKNSIDMLIIQGTADKYGNDITITPNNDDINSQYRIFQELAGSTNIDSKAGVMVILGPKFKAFTVKKMTILAHRILAVNLSHKEFNVTAIAAYAHQEQTDTQTRNSFWKSLHSSIKQLKQKTQLILGIDTNGHIGSDPPTPFIQTHHKPHNQHVKWNNNGHSFADLCTANSLTATNAMNSSKNKGHTWTTRAASNSINSTPIIQHRID